MAPTHPSSHRTARPARSILKTASVQPRSSASKSEALFAASKKDKLRIKHAQLVSKITKPTTASKRRRRPSKKLVTTLDALADALPQAETIFDEEHVDQATPDRQVNIIKRKSVKSRPGALKRREKLDNAERERFAKNMAQLSDSHAADTACNTPHESAVQISDPRDRWTALRGFIAQTLEKRT